MGWAVREIDGHDMGAVNDALEWANEQPGPACIIGRTVKGKGVSFMEGENKYHGVAPSNEEMNRGAPGARRGGGRGVHRGGRPREGGTVKDLFPGSSWAGHA
jgi:hypothetical protein